LKRIEDSPIKSSTTNISYQQELSIGMKS